MATDDEAEDGEQNDKRWSIVKRASGKCRLTQVLGEEQRGRAQRCHCGKCRAPLSEISPGVPCPNGCSYRWRRNQSSGKRRRLSAWDVQRQERSQDHWEVLERRKSAKRETSEGSAKPAEILEDCSKEEAPQLNEERTASQSSDEVSLIPDEVARDEDGNVDPFWRQRRANLLRFQAEGSTAPRVEDPSQPDILKGLERGNDVGEPELGLVSDGVPAAFQPSHAAPRSYYGGSDEEDGNAEEESAEDASILTDEEENAEDEGNGQGQDEVEDKYYEERGEGQEVGTDQGSDQGSDGQDEDDRNQCGEGGHEAAYVSRDFFGYQDEDGAYHTAPLEDEDEDEDRSADEVPSGREDIPLAGPPSRGRESGDNTAATKATTPTGNVPLAGPSRGPESLENITATGITPMLAKLSLAGRSGGREAWDNSTTTGVTSQHADVPLPGASRRRSSPDNTITTGVTSRPVNRPPSGPCRARESSDNATTIEVENKDQVDNRLTSGRNIPTTPADAILEAFSGGATTTEDESERSTTDDTLPGRALRGKDPSAYERDLDLVKRYATANGRAALNTVIQIRLVRALTQIRQPSSRDQYQDAYDCATSGLDLARLALETDAGQQDFETLSRIAAQSHYYAGLAAYLAGPDGFERAAEHLRSSLEYAGNTDVLGRGRTEEVLNNILQFQQDPGNLDTNAQSSSRWAWLRNPFGSLSSMAASLWSSPYDNGVTPNGQRLNSNMLDGELSSGQSGSMRSFSTTGSATPSKGSGTGNLRSYVPFRLASFEYGTSARPHSAGSQVSPGTSHRTIPVVMPVTKRMTISIGSSGSDRTSPKPRPMMQRNKTAPSSFGSSSTKLGASRPGSSNGTVSLEAILGASIRSPSKSDGISQSGSRPGISSLSIASRRSSGKLPVPGARPGSIPTTIVEERKDTFARDVLDEGLGLTESPEGYPQGLYEAGLPNARQDEAYKKRDGREEAERIDESSTWQQKQEIARRLVAPKVNRMVKDFGRGLMDVMLKTVTLEEMREYCLDTNDASLERKIWEMMCNKQAKKEAAEGLPPIPPTPRLRRAQLAVVNNSPTSPQIPPTPRLAKAKLAVVNTSPISPRVLAILQSPKPRLAVFNTSPRGYVPIPQVPTLARPEDEVQAVGTGVSRGTMICPQAGPSRVSAPPRSPKPGPSRPRMSPAPESHEAEVDAEANKPPEDLTAPIEAKGAVAVGNKRLEAPTTPPEIPYLPETPWAPRKPRTTPSKQNESPPSPLAYKSEPSRRPSGLPSGPTPIDDSSSKHRRRSSILQGTLNILTGGGSARATSAEDAAERGESPVHSPVVEKREKKEWRQSRLSFQVVKQRKMLEELLEEGHSPGLALEGFGEGAGGRLYTF